MSKGNILLLEHSLKTMECISAVLHSFDVKLNGNTDPKDALRKCTLSEYDIVIADHKPPALDGVEFVRQLREFRSKVPIIIMAEDLNPDFVCDISEFSIDGFFSKPLRLEKFTKRVRQILDSRKSRLGKIAHLSNPVDYIKLAKKKLSSAGFNWTKPPWPSKSAS